MGTITKLRKSHLSPVWALVLFIGVFAAYLELGVPALTVWAQQYFELTSLHEKTIFWEARSVVLDWGGLALAVLFLRMRGKRLKDIGWGRIGAVWGWVFSIAIVGFFVWLILIRPSHFLDRAAWLSDWSLFRISLAVVAALTAGVCEETIFRGFLMSEAHDAGASATLQILLSAILFGLSHVGWGGLSGHFDFMAAFGAFWSTALFGAAFAGVYLLARRSLIPGVLGHASFVAITEPWMMMMALAGSLNLGH